VYSNKTLKEPGVITHPMDIIKHKREFDRVIAKYSLADKADEIANYIVKRKTIQVHEFATLFNMEEDDAEILLSFIKRGIEFKEKYIDPK
jgi:hypothetical protein